MPPLHLNQAELAARWRISPKTLARWRWAGEGPRFLKLGSRVVYRLIDINAFEAAHLRRRTDDRIAVTAHSFTHKRGERRKGLAQGRSRQGSA